MKDGVAFYSFAVEKDDADDCFFLALHAIDRGF